MINILKLHKLVYIYIYMYIYIYIFYLTRNKLYLIIFIKKNYMKIKIHEFFFYINIKILQ